LAFSKPAGVAALRLYEQLVGIAAGKTIDLVFNARAVTRANAPDATVEHRAAVETLTQGFVNLLARIGYMARHLINQRRGLGVAEAAGVFVAVLNFHLRPVEATAIEACRGTGLHASSFET